MKRTLLLLTAVGLITNATLADVVYVTARPLPSGAGANPDGTYTELITGSDTSAKSSATGTPTRDGERFFYGNTFSNSQYNGSAFLMLTPTLGVPGGIYQVHYTHSSTANNTALDPIIRMSNAAACTLSWTNTDKFQRKYGQPAPQQWQLLGYLTNDPGSFTPTIALYLVSITNADSTIARTPVDCFRFSQYVPCLDVSPVGVTGPLSSSSNAVVVTGVTNTATKLTVYQDSGSGMVAIGSKTSGIVAGNNTVTVSGLIKGARVAATQTVNAQEGCVPTTGTLVGGGANPRIRMALSIRETTSTGPIGSSGVTTNTAIHFLGATTVVGGSPGDGLVVYPSNDWQTITFDRGTVLISDSTNAAGSTADGPGYNPNDSVAIRVYAYRTVPETGVLIYSRVGAQSSTVTSNDFFSVNWSWDAVAGADGYRLLRNLNSAGYVDFTDVGSANTFNDQNNAWSGGSTVTPNSTQTNSSIQWNPTANSNPNNIPGQWATLEGIALVIDDLSDTGPFDLYIDNLQNGSTIWQTFENYPGSSVDVGFRTPSFSGTTSGNILTGPDRSIVSVRAADTGTKSLRVRFQWVGTNATSWLRLTTSGVGNPQVNLDLPISFRLLMQPVGASLPIQPPPPVLTISQTNSRSVLGWIGGHNLQTAALVNGTYTNVPAIALGPWTNSFTEPNRFFRLADPYDN